MMMCPSSRHTTSLFHTTLRKDRRRRREEAAFCIHIQDSKRGDEGPEKHLFPLPFVTLTTTVMEMMIMSVMLVNLGRGSRENIHREKSSSRASSVSPLYLLQETTSSTYFLEKKFFLPSADRKEFTSRFLRPNSDHSIEFNQDNIFLITVIIIPIRKKVERIVFSLAIYFPQKESCCINFDSSSYFREVKEIVRIVIRLGSQQQTSSASSHLSKDSISIRYQGTLDRVVTFGCSNEPSVRKLLLLLDSL